MGRPLTRSRAGEIVPCTRAITPSSIPSEEGFRGLHVATLGAKDIPNAHEYSVGEALHLREIPLRKDGLSKGLSRQHRSEGKHSPKCIPSFQSLAPCSPSESSTSSKVSKLGFSSSSSYSSSSSFNEAGSFVAEELSPASVTSAGVKQAECSATRRSYHRGSLTAKLAAVASVSDWNDTEMHCTCSSSPAQSTTQTVRAADNLPLEDNLLEGSKGRRQLCTRSRNDNLGYDNLDWAGYDEGDKIASVSVGHGRNVAVPINASKPQTGIREEGYPSSSCIKSLHCVLEGPSKFSSKEIDGKDNRHGSASFWDSSDSTLSLGKCTIASNFSSGGVNATLHATKYLSSDRRDYSTAIYNDVKCEVHINGVSEKCNTSLKLRKDHPTTCSTIGDSTLEGRESTEFSKHGKADTQSIFKGVLECSSTPYDADIGVDTLSLQPRAASLSPNEKTKLPRAFSLHRPVHTNEGVFSFQIPVVPKPKLDTQCSAPLHLFERGMSMKRSTEQRTCTEPAFGKRKVASNGFSSRGTSMIQARIGCSDQKPASAQNCNRSYVISHPQDPSHKDSRAILIPLVSSKHHFYNEILKPSVVASCDDKADVFTVHSPLLLKELKHLEGGDAPTLNTPIVPFTSKAHWDWRSKSMGAKASLKSAVRNLEATFTSSRSASLPKTRPWAPKDAKPERARLLERVFVSPIRGRSKQASFLKPIERPLFPNRQSSGVKEHGAFWQQDAKTLTSNRQFLRATACSPAGSVVRPFPRNGYKEVEVTCKPFLPASRSARCLPAPRGTLGMESLASSGRKADGLSSCAPDGASPSMLHALMQCILKDGLPYYSMTVEGSEEMFLARACLQENHSSKEGCKWQYSFYSEQGKTRGTGGSGGWRSWVKKESKAVSDLSGIMEVSSTICNAVAQTAREEQHLKVLEFVLYDGKGAGVAHSQSLRFCPMEKLSQKSGSLRESPSSEHVLSSSPFQLGTVSTDRQHVRSLTEFSVSSESASTASSLPKGNGAHRPSLSLDVWSDSDMPDSVQVPTSSCSLSHVELAALVIQVSAEGCRRDSNVSEGDLIDPNCKGWGLKFLDGGDELELRSGTSLGHAAKPIIFDCDALHQGGIGTSAELKRCPVGNRSGHPCTKINRDGLLNGNSNAVEEFQDLSVVEKFGRQGSSGNVTLLLPTGDHSFPSGGKRGPSSLIERWRSGGSCECGGWDLGCGIKVISNESSTKKYSMPDKHLISYDQQLSLFVQGSKQELMLGLILVKQGEFKLSFQGQLSPLKAFAVAVAMLHSESTLLSSPASSLISSRPPLMPSSLSSSSASMSSLIPLAFAPSSASMSSSSFKFPLSSPPSLLSSSSLMSSLAIEARSIVNNLKERPPRAPQIRLPTPRRSDLSSKDKISPFLVHNQTFSD